MYSNDISYPLRLHKGGNGCSIKTWKNVKKKKNENENEGHRLRIFTEYLSQSLLRFLGYLATIDQDLSIHTALTDKGHGLEWTGGMKLHALVDPKIGEHEYENQTLVPAHAKVKSNYSQGLDSVLLSVI